jgi:hypothetical protein
MHPKYHSLIVAAALAIPSLACRNDVTGVDSVARPSLSTANATQVAVNLLEITRFVPCANGGQGEDVFLSGRLHSVFHTSLDGNGGAHVVVVRNPQGISGTGLTTGAKYRGVGGSPEDVFNVRVGEVHTSVLNIRIIGQGPGNNFTIHENAHTTVLADGRVTSFHDNLSIECR